MTYLRGGCSLVLELVPIHVSPRLDHASYKFLLRFLSNLVLDTHVYAHAIALCTF